MKKKIAIINQRYGREVNGGSEYYTKVLAEHLQKRYDVTVLTTTALNYDTWKNHYPEGDQIVDGIAVKRFPVVGERSKFLFRITNKVLRMCSKHPEWLERLWIIQQGPYCPQLRHFLKEDHFDAYIFTTYLYYTTAMGILDVADKAILVPTAHDEPFIYFDYFKKVFSCPRMIIYLTEEEQRFVTGLFEKLPLNSAVLGMGIDVPEDVSTKRFREKHHITDRYVVYVGRVDSGKKCDEMFSHFLSYKKQYKTGLKLLVMGKATMEIPEHPDIIALGFVDEEEKYDGIQGAEALILPSEYESLSIAVLEAMALGTLVVVNGGCDVLKGHVERSGAGFYYLNESEFIESIRVITQEGSKNEEMRNKGIQYVEKNYNWKQILDKYCMAVDNI